jgi:hypothetical protein
MKNKWMAAAVLALGTTLSACAAHGGYAMHYGPPPPAPRYGIVGVAPGPGYIWADGYWESRGGGWYWAPGQWLRPPRPRAVWVPGYWSRYGRGYAFHRGYWR